MEGMEETIEGTAPAESDAANADEALSPERERELLERFRDWFTADDKAEQENQKRAEAAERYKLGGRYQWEDVGSEDADRPEMSINLVPQFVNQVVNDQRQNRAEIRFKPVGGGADKETAQVIDGIVRHIQQRSRATWAYDWAMQQSVGGGYGYYWVEPVYVDDETNNQELRICWVASRSDVRWDHKSMLPWGGDAQHAFRVGWMSREMLKEMGGKAAEVADAASGAWVDSWGQHSTWERSDREKDEVRVCAVWWLEPKLITVKGRSRPAVQPQLKWAKFTARGIIEGPRNMPGHRIPGVRVVGNMDVLDEGLYLYGLVELCKPQQDFFNTLANDAGLRLSMHPAIGVLAQAGTLGKHRQEWIDAVNGKPMAIGEYEGSMLDDTTPAPPPSAWPFPTVPAGHVTLMQQAEHWLRAGTGMYEASLGQQGQEVSGRALLQRRREGDAATFHYHDYANYGLLALGEILLELIPYYYDWKETAEILDEEHNEQFVTLAPQGSLKNSAGKPVAHQARPDEKKPGKKTLLYDLSVGRYDVVVDTGPSHATKREEAAETMVNLMPNMGEHWLLAADQFFKFSDFPGADVLATRFTEAVQQAYPWVKQLEQTEGDGPTEREQLREAQAQLQQIVPAFQEMQMVMEQMAQELASEEQKQQLELLRIRADVQRDEMEAQGTVVVAQIQAATERMKVMAEIMGQGGQGAQAPDVQGMTVTNGE